MKGWIELHILYNTDQSQQLTDMGITPKDDDYELQEELVQVSTISSIKLTGNDNDCTRISICGVASYCLESPEKIRTLINFDRLKKNEFE